MENMESINLERTNALRLELAREEWLDIFDFIDKYAAKVRDLLDAWIIEKDAIKNALK